MQTTTQATARQLRTVAAMKRWALANYERGADTMVECWPTDEYLDLLRRTPTTAEAWAVLRAVAAVYRDQQADARNSAF